MVGLLYLWNTISYLLSSAALITLELIISTYLTSTNTTTGWIRREKSRNLAKHDAIKEDGHQCFVGSPYISCLLSSFFWCDSCSPYSRGKLVSFSGRSTCRMFSLPKLVDKSSSLLLENQGNSKSSEGIHNRIFLLFLDLICIQICVTKVKSLDKSCFTGLKIEEYFRSP